MTMEIDLSEDGTAQEDELREWPSAIDTVEEWAGRNDVALAGQTVQSTTAAGQGCRPYGHCVKNAEPRWMALEVPKAISPDGARRGKLSLKRQVSWGDCLSSDSVGNLEADLFGLKTEGLPDSLPKTQISADSLGYQGAGSADTDIFRKRNGNNEDTDKFAELLNGIVANLQSMTIAVRKMEDWQKRHSKPELRTSNTVPFETTESRRNCNSMNSARSVVSSTTSTGSVPSSKVAARSASALGAKSGNSGRSISSSATNSVLDTRRISVSNRRTSFNITASKLRLRETWEISEDSGEIAEDSMNIELIVTGLVSGRAPGENKAKLRRGATTRHMAQKRNWVLHPYSFFRLVWNILCLVALFYDIFVIPLQGFATVLPEDVETAMRIMDWILASLWTVDMLFSAGTGYYVKAILHMEPLDVTLQYAKTWMFFDLTLVGYSWYEVVANDRIRFGNVFRMRAFWALRWLRLGRLWKMHALWRIIEDQINTNLFHLCFGLVKLTTALIIMVHIVTCIWFYLGESQVHGWTSYYESAVDGPRDFFFWYFASSRWTLAQINGRTDINEKRTIQELYYTCVVAILFAVIFMSIFISSITTTMVELSAAAEAETSTRRLLNEYLGYYQVPLVLVGSVKRHLRDMTFQDDQQKEQKLLERLPRQLAIDLLYEIHAPVLKTAPFFQEIDNECPRVMRQLCFGAINCLSVHKWEMIFDFGDVCARMLVVRKGDLMYSRDMGAQDFWIPDYQNPDARAPPGESIQNGILICEAALWVEWVNHGRLIAAAQSSLLSLEAKKFADFLRDYRDAWFIAATYARSFLRAIKEAEEMSDVFAVTMTSSPAIRAYESELSSGAAGAGAGSQMSQMLEAWTGWRPSFNRSSSTSNQRTSEGEVAKEVDRQGSGVRQTGSWQPQILAISEKDENE